MPFISYVITLIAGLTLATVCDVKFINEVNMEHAFFAVGIFLLSIFLNLATYRLKKRTLELLKRANP